MLDTGKNGSSVGSHPVSQQYMYDFSSVKTPYIIQGDVAVSLLDNGSEIFRVWFNTNFVDDTGIVHFGKSEMDFQTDSKNFSQGFTIELELSEVIEENKDIFTEAANQFYHPHFNDY